MATTTTDARTEAFAADLAHDPRTMLNYPPEVVHALPPAELDPARLELVRARVAKAVSDIPLIGQLAQLNAITEIADFDGLVPLLYTHETYKSYPQAWLERADFRKLTRWLGKLCAADLSSVDASGCGLIEEWMATLLDQSEIDIQISASGDGKGAFMPRSKAEWALLQRINMWGLLNARGADGADIGLKPGVDRVPLIYLGARRGARSMSRFLDYYEEMFGEGLVDTLMEYADSDLLSLAGRIREASKKGEAGLVQIKDELLARKDEIARLNADKPKRMEALMQRLLNDYRGKRIVVQGTMQLVYDLAMRFREMGVNAAYTPDSLFICGSGFVGGAEPPNWKQEVAQILGVPEAAIRIGYGMQEALWAAHMCEHGKFHLPPTIVPFVLDENDDHPLPREGRQTGRFAFFDLLPDTAWGGFATGDRVTLTWDEPCGCGRKSGYLDSPIRRIETIQDDKITCAGTAGALEEATDFLLNS